MVMITPAEFEDKMKTISSNSDMDLAHRAADELLCDALCDLGYESGVKIFKEMNKWYA